MSPKETRLPATSGPVEEYTKVLSETIVGPIPSTDRGRPQVERRAFARRKAKGKITYQIGDSRVGPSHKATAVDISQNGIGFIADKLLAIGTQLWILRETPYRGQNVSVQAQVRWVTPIAEKQFRVGCSLERRLQYTEMQSFLQ
jgi:PilZ domain